MDAAWLLLLGLSLSGSVLWSGARRRAPSQTAELTIALTVAALDAARRGHARVRPAHLVAAALVARVHASPPAPYLTRARDAIDRVLDGLPATPEPLAPHTVQLSPALLRAVQNAARAATARMCPLGLDAVLDELAADEETSELVHVARTPAPPPSAPPSCVGAPYRAPPPDQHAEVILWNDEVSTMEGVLDVLRECFAKGEPEALHLMLTTHYVGQATVGRYGWDEANARAARATARARRLGMPLRVTVAFPDADAPAAKTTLGERLWRLFTAA